MQLNGVTVLDLSWLYPGPYGTQLLADLGAEVIKIERPETGDPARHLPPTAPNEIGGIFDVVNRGKKSLTLNLSTERGQSVFYSLCSDADVIVEQFRPGVVDKLGIDYETVREYNGDIIYCSISGYGQVGPEAERVGHDLSYIARSGLLDLSRPSVDDPPVQPGYFIADNVGGLFATLSITSALLSRELNPAEGGDYIDISMTDVVFSFSQPVVAGSKGFPQPGESTTSGRFPWYDIYKTADSRYLTLAAFEKKFWESFCHEVERPDLISEHTTNPDDLDSERRAEIRGILTDLFESKSLAEWKEKFQGVDVMVEPVNTVKEAWEDPLFDSRELIQKSDKSLPRVRFPANVASGDVGVDASPPQLGEHTEQILSSHGFTKGEISSLAEDEII